MKLELDGTALLLYRHQKSQNELANMNTAALSMSSSNIAKAVM